MICTSYVKGELATRYHKYSNPLFGEKQIYNRVDGKWEKREKHDPQYYKLAQLSISDKGVALCSTPN